MADNSLSSLGKIFRSGAFVFLGRILELGISFVGAALVARYIGRTGFGSVSLGSTLLTFTASFVLLGTQTGVARYLPRFDGVAERRGVLLSAAQILLPLSLLTGAAYFVFADVIARRIFTDPAITPVIRVFAVGVPFIALEKFARGAVQGTQRTIPQVILQNIIIPSTRISLVVVALLAGARAVGISWAYVGAHVAAAVVGVYFLHRYTPFFDRVGATMMRKELLVFSAPLTVAAIMSKILIDMDTFLLGYFVSTGDVGVYRVVYPLANLVLIVLTSFGYLFMPVISELESRDAGGELRETFQTITKWVFLLSVPIVLALALFPRPIIGLTFGAEYVSGAVALSILSVGFFVHAVAGPNDNTLNAIGHTRLIMADNVVVAALNVVLNVVLIPRYSYVGAAAATAVSYTVLNLLYSTQLYRRTGLYPVTRTLLTIAGVLAASTVVVYVGVYTFLGTELLGMVAFAAGMAPVYVLSILRLGGVEEREVEMVLGFEDRYGVDLGPVKSLVKRLM